MGSKTALNVKCKSIFSILLEGKKEPKAGDDGSEFCFRGGKESYPPWEKKATLSPSAAPPFPPLNPVFGILGHCAIWDIWYLSDVSVWDQLAMLRKMTDESTLYRLSFSGFWSEGRPHRSDRALLALPLPGQFGAECLFHPLLGSIEGVCARWHCTGNSTVDLGVAWCPHLPWAQECHLLISCCVTGPTTDLVSERNKCPINTYLFIQQVNWALWKTSDVPAFLQDTCKTCSCVCLEEVWAAISFGHLCVSLFSMLAEIRAFYWWRVNSSADLHLVLSVLGSRDSLAVAEPHQLKGNLLHICLGIMTHLLFSQQMSEGLYAKHQTRPRGRADSFLWPRKEPAVLFP